MPALSPCPKCNVHHTSDVACFVVGQTARASPALRLSWDALDSPAATCVVLPPGQGAYVALQRPNGNAVLKLPIASATERRSIKSIEVFVHFLEEE